MKRKPLYKTLVSIGVLWVVFRTMMLTLFTQNPDADPGSWAIYQVPVFIALAIGIMEFDHKLVKD